MTRKRKPAHQPPGPKRQPPKWQREKNLSLFVWIFISATILVLVTLIGIWAYDNYVAVWNRTMATVNDTTIDMRDFVRTLRIEQKLRGPNPTTDFAQGILEEMENNEVIRQRTSSLGITIPSGNITQTIQDDLSILLGGNLTETEQDERYREWLHRMELTDEQVRQVVEEDLLEIELREYLQENEVPEEAKQVHLFELVRSTEEEATAARDKLLGGNVTLAEELQAGDLGWVPEGIHSDYDGVAFSLAAGNTSEPIFTPPNGYAIIRVTEIEESRTISENHRVTLADAAFDAWLADARLTGTISRHADFDDIEWAVDRIE